jgi:hypothetical protein
MSSGANGLLLGQLTETPGMSVSEAGSGHGSMRRDQLTAAAMTGKATETSSNASRSERDSAKRYSVFLNTA